MLELTESDSLELACTLNDDIWLFKVSEELDSRLGVLC